jgi:hypothetical protein
MIDQTKVDDKHKPETQSASTRPGQFDTLLTTRSKLFAPKPGGQAPLPDSLEFTDLQPKKASSSPDDASYLVMTGLFGDNTPGTGKGFTAEGEKKKVEPGEDKSSEGKGVGGYGKGRNGEGTPEYDKTKTQDVDRSGAAGYGKGINGEGTPEYEQLKKKDGKDLAVGDRKNGPEKESDRVKLKDADGEKEKLLARVKAFEDKYNVKFGQEGEAVAYRDKKTTCR